MDGMITQIFMVNFYLFRFKLYFHLNARLLIELKVMNCIDCIILYYHGFQIIIHFSKYDISLVFKCIKSYLNYPGA